MEKEDDKSIMSPFSQNGNPYARSTLTNVTVTVAPTGGTLTLYGENGWNEPDNWQVVTAEALAGTGPYTVTGAQDYIPSPYAYATVGCQYIFTVTYVVTGNTRVVTATAGISQQAPYQGPF